jgi:hypothetical protein
MNYTLMYDQLLVLLIDSFEANLKTTSFVGQSSSAQA